MNAAADATHPSPGPFFFVSPSRRLVCYKSVRPKKISTDDTIWVTVKEYLTCPDTSNPIVFCVNQCYFSRADIFMAACRRISLLEGWTSFSERMSWWNWRAPSNMSDSKSPRCAVLDLTLWGLKHVSHLFLGNKKTKKTKLWTEIF